MKRRHSEEGAISIVIAAAMVMLFGMAALAVDIGTAYTRRLGVQAAADAAALAGARNGISTTRALTVATKNGFTSGVTATSPWNSRSDLINVRISVPGSKIFSSAFGVTARNIVAQATAVATPTMPAVMSLGPACTDAGGVRINAPSLTITGNVASYSYIDYNVTGAVTNGSATYASSSCPNTSDGGSTISGGLNLGTPPTDPFSTISIATFTTCDYGNLTLGVNQSFNNPTGNGVYCSGGRLDIQWGTAINLNLTLVARGQINISGTLGTMTARSNGLVAYSAAAVDCPASQAINIGNAQITMNGSFYAPNGCLNLNADAMTINGALIGKSVQIQAGSASTVTGPGGASSGNSYLLN